ncbi:N-acetylmuramoyl-L-alanine amidase [Candidatus Epulonipiscium viviparus]|uniref:N-acetylmuramoyl-L-alanine amidase n=1 Tax=Candidatus Epulonipiscium viviparus TaxID=420336 RepID=UPI0027381461|nr:N-acetylmuramoyl-L-alanine amidase [Candidatus Epulopiscium viviparus]
MIVQKPLIDIELISKAGINKSTKPLIIDKESNMLLLTQYNKSIIEIIDNYKEREIIIDLGADYSAAYASTKLQVNSDNIREIEILNDKTTQLIIKSNQICAYNQTETASGLNLEIVRPEEKYAKILVLDIGHGGNDPGTLGNGLIEKELNTEHAFAIKDFIETNSDIKIYMTRELDETLALTYRTDLANEIGAHLFVSVHNNSHTSDIPNGSEVFYFPSEDDTTSKLMAEAMIEKIVEYTGMFNRGAKPSSKLIVLKTSQMPSLLIEGGFLSNIDDAKKLGQSEFTTSYSKAVAETIIEFFK